MALVYNGTTISAVVYNGVTLDSVQFNGTVVYTSAPAQTSTPTITDKGYDIMFSMYTYTVKNNDSSTATVWYEVNDNTPDNSMSLGGGATSGTKSYNSTAPSVTVYAKAQASGETMSGLRSKVLYKGM